MVHFAQVRLVDNLRDNTTREQSNKNNIYDVGWRPFAWRKWRSRKKNRLCIFVLIRPEGVAPLLSDQDEKFKSGNVVVGFSILSL